MKIYTIITLLLFLPFTAKATTNSIQTAENLTEWMTSSQYQHWFNKKIVKGTGFYPIFVEGRLIGGEERYRAIIALRPLKNFTFWTHHGISEDYYKKQLKNLSQKGYTLISHQTFIDMLGNTRHQATWVKVKAPIQSPVSKTNTESLYSESKYGEFSKNQYTRWMAFPELQKFSDTFDYSNNWIYRSEGRNHKGLSQYRYAYKKKPNNVIAYQIRSGRSSDQFKSIGIDYVRNGYERVSLQLFVDSSGITRHQSIWFKYKDLDKRSKTNQQNQNGTAKRAKLPLKLYTPGSTFQNLRKPTKR